jgi:hypothetical protein
MERDVKAGQTRLAKAVNNLFCPLPTTTAFINSDPPSQILLSFYWGRKRSIENGCSFIWNMPLFPELFIWSCPVDSSCYLWTVKGLYLIQSFPLH